MVGCDRLHSHTDVGTEVHEFLHVGAITLLRIRLQTLLHSEIRSKLLYYPTNVGDGSHKLILQLQVAADDFVPWQTLLVEHVEEWIGVELLHIVHARFHP